MQILKSMFIWVVWRFVQLKNGKKSKVPYSALSLKKTGPSAEYCESWCSYEDASAIANENHFNGTGFVIPDGYGVIDIDHADDDFIREIHELVNSYMEKSPSGEGVHIIFTVDTKRIPQNNGKLDGYFTNNRELGMEIYLGGLTNRYMTYTGNALTDDNVNDCTNAIREFLDKYMKKNISDKSEEIRMALSESVLSDEEILKNARNAENRKKFIRLYDLREIEDYPSQSEADQALCNILAYWTKGDADAIDRLFRKSALYRDKWEKNEVYRKKTIQNAIIVYRSAPNNDEPKMPPFAYVNDNGNMCINSPLLANYFQEHQHILSVRDNGMGSVLRYIYESGCYRVYSDEMIKGLIKKYISELDESLIRMRDINEVYQLLCTDLNFVTSDRLNADENLINFQNGLLNLDTMELLPHSPLILSTIQIPCFWTGKETPTPVFDAFIDTFTNHDHAIVQLLLEVMGVVISNVKGYRTKKALFIIGPGDSGKSVLKSLVELIIGRGNYMPTDLEELEKRFGTGYIAGKRLVGTSDMSFMTIAEIKSFKKCTGGDALFGEFKGIRGFDLTFNGILWFCMNRLPKFGGDDGQWVYDRIMVVEAPNSIPLHKQDKNLLDKLYAEREGIVFKAIQALKNVINNGYRFSEPDSVIRARERYKAENNTVIAFFIECMVEVTDGNIGEGASTSKVYRVYAEWCRENNHGYAKTAKEFRDDLSRHLHTDYKDLVIHRNTGSYYRSYSLTEAAKNEYQRVYGPMERDDNPFICTK